MLSRNGQKVSIIIPAYNVEDYISDCLDSVINQDYRNTEIIVIDDGSSDSTWDIIRKYEKNNANVKAIHSNNNGVQIARRMGIELSTGELLMFVDGDDYVSSTYVSDLIVELEDADLVTSGIHRLDIDGLVIADWVDNYSPGRYSRSDVDYIFENLIIFAGERPPIPIGGVLNSACSKLYRKNIVDHIYKDACSGTVSIEEDWLFVILYMLQSNTFVFTRKINYYYRYNISSAVHAVHDDFLFDRAEYYRIIKKHILQNPKAELLLSQFQRRLMFSIISGFQSFMHFDPQYCIPTYAISELDELKNKKIVLYGAGKVGRDYKGELTRHKEIELVAWTDSDSTHHPDCISLNKILEIEFDIIVIAVLNELQARIVQENLENMGICQKKILWRMPRLLLDEFFLY